MSNDDQILAATDAPLVLTLKEAIVLLGTKDMMLEHVPAWEHPWRVRYRNSPLAKSTGPTPYTQHAFGDTWPQALTAALGRPVFEWDNGIEL